MGYARNCRDGSVEVVAEGPRERLNQLLGKLRRGPSAARVDDVRFDFSPASGEFTEFATRY
jgi:acylphosphatase